ncbi:MAG: helix-turn-helix domain-containing protein [Bacteroidota bacterium]
MNFYTARLAIVTGLSVYISLTLPPDHHQKPMELQQQLVFFFSALGAANGMALSAYFGFFRKPSLLWHRLLGGLLFVLSFRILKSVFRHFNPQLFEQFVHAGLIACALIGPFLLAYAQRVVQPKSKSFLWALHVVPFLVLMLSISAYFSYYEERALWRQIIQGIYWQWLLYLLITLWTIRAVLIKSVQKKSKLSDAEILLLNVFGGVALIWLAYFTSSYTSYIVGALTFSFLLYLSVVLWALNRKSTQIERAPYADKHLQKAIILQIEHELETKFLTPALYKNPNLKLAELAGVLGVSTHQLSQYLNEHQGKSFNQFINKYRIEAAKQELITNRLFTIEAIGYECGFNSKSSFFSTFKKMVGCTPAAYRKTQGA